MKKFWKKGFAVGLAAVVVSAAYMMLSAEPMESFASEQSQQQELTVRFDMEYPEVEKELNLQVEGLNDGEGCGFIWKVDDKIVSQWDSYTPTAADLEKFIKVEARTTEGRSAEYTVYFSKLPVVYIDTNDVPIQDKENYVKGSMKIQGNAKYNSANSTLYDGGLEIRGRGNSSWEAPKKPYRLKLSSKANLLGMGSNKHWTLLANYYDPSLSRNKLSYDFSGELGLAYMSSENVVLIMNDKYQGVYQLCEHIRIDKNRIDITDWEKVAEDAAEMIADTEGFPDVGDLEDSMIEDMEWITTGQVSFQGESYQLEDYGIELPDIDGGYLLELDKNQDEVSCFYTSKQQPLMFKSPEYVKTNSDMMNYVKDYINAFENAIDTPDGYTNYMGEKMHYTELFDMDALAQYFLVTELFFNVDGMKKSTYLYKPNGEPMKMGPIWDMDWCAGSPYEQASPADRWQSLFYDDEIVRDQWYRSLVDDPYFAYKVKGLYDGYRENIESFVSEGGRIDENIEYLKEAGAKNDAKWTSQTSTFLSNSENLKKWMKQRISWLDQQTESVDSLLASWGVYKSNQNNEDVVSVQEVVSAEEGIKVSVHTTSVENVGIYINGIKYAEKTAENQVVTIVIPYESLKNATEDMFVVARTMSQGKVCTSYKTAVAQLPEVTPEPTPEPTPEVTPEPTPEVKEDVSELYPDVKDGAWYETGVQFVYDNGLMSGNNGLFNPTSDITRAQLVTTLYRLAGEPEVTDRKALTDFTDVTEGKYYTDAVCWAYVADVTTGTNGKFNPSGKLTRQQMAAFFYRFADVMGRDTTARGDYSSMVNADKVSGYAAEPVAWAVGEGLIGGSDVTVDGITAKDLNPRGNTTRAQVAAILMRFCVVI